jgi:hypothetical protein
VWRCCELVPRKWILVYGILQLKGAGVLWDTENRGDCEPPIQPVSFIFVIIDLSLETVCAAVYGDGKLHNMFNLVCRQHLISNGWGQRSVYLFTSSSLYWFFATPRRSTSPRRRRRHGNGGLICYGIWHFSAIAGPTTVRLCRYSRVPAPQCVGLYSTVCQSRGN